MWAWRWEAGRGQRKRRKVVKENQRTFEKSLENTLAKYRVMMVVGEVRKVDFIKN